MQDVVLAMLAKEPSHGYHLRAWLRRVLGPLGESMNAGQVYVTLARLERAGLVVRERTEGPPDRKVYALTPAGRQRVATWLTEVNWPKQDLAELHLKLSAAKAARLADPVELVAVHRRELLGRLRQAQRALLAEPDGSTAGLLLEGVALRLQADLRWLRACEQLGPPDTTVRGLPVPVLLGLRLIARRPGRAFLQACGIAATVITITALLIIFVQHRVSYGIDSSHLSNLKDAQSRHMIVVVAAALVTVAAVNTLTTTWTTALEARHTMAVARTLGATPGQITAGLSAAQLLPTVPGALVGIPLGIAFCWPFSNAGTIYPPAWWLFGAALTAVLATAVLTALPARIAARRSVAQTLSAETT
ncbi:PadR family transcriptional regulator [Streptomyces scopuliridis]|uniref:PadR family transcriptional regulator n=1 Tax=Streptomyces scopuliridis TaxID=452529 RepID=A0ACD4ZRQ6_9ACTN|nr:PadR family transcriptional regulator [Streptomyces scopuliridis]WSC00654.1 PadR family transcriptional regulator [Streptomyces scopuliridis]WSC05735.1 PadR family transcriptional regulator [Streptomyces scopuliridis]